jgi:hypothetical protein
LAVANIKFQWRLENGPAFTNNALTHGIQGLYLINEQKGLYLIPGWLTRESLFEAVCYLVGILYKSFNLRMI